MWHFPPRLSSFFYSDANLHHPLFLLRDTHPTPKDDQTESDTLKEMSGMRRWRRTGNFLTFQEHPLIKITVSKYLFEKGSRVWGFHPLHISPPSVLPISLSESTTWNIKSFLKVSSGIRVSITFDLSTRTFNPLPHFFSSHRRPIPCPCLDWLIGRLV